jgi:hypothetical protein
MESLERHLSTGFTDGLRSNRADCRSRLDDGSEISDSTDFEKGVNLVFSHLVCVFDDLLDGS